MVLVLVTDTLSSFIIENSLHITDYTKLVENIFYCQIIFTCVADSVQLPEVLNQNQSGSQPAGAGSVFQLTFFIAEI